MVVDTTGGKLHPTKYLHAEFDLSTNTFTHFDVAIQLFNAQEYFQVRDCFLTNARNTSNQVKGKYHKLLKITI